MRRILLLLLIPPGVNAQVLTSNASLSILSGALVHVNGGAVISSGSMVNEGTLIVSSNSSLPLAGSFTITGAATVSGNGLYKVEKDWINNAVFTADQSTVELFGNTQQLITSLNNTVTEFHNLTLSGNGTGANRKKTLNNVNAMSNGVLALNDRELETQTNKFTVLAPSLTTITNDVTPGNEGFVSSISPGMLTRATEQQGAYLFPTGSSAGTLRYRPVEITTTVFGLGAFSARLNNFDATASGFDRDDNDGTFCSENPNFFHSIERNGGTNAVDIRMFYIPAADGSFTGMGHWRTTNLLWNNMGTVSAGTAPPFATLSKAAWNFANPGNEYILTNIRPDKPQINCPLICENSTGNAFSASGSTGNYQWTVPPNGSIASGQGTAAMTADWTTGSGYVYVIATGANGCNSLPDSCQPSVYARPVANFAYAIDGSMVHFNDLSSNASEWDWDFGNDSSSSAMNPSEEYGGGDYTVVLTVSNPAGCTDDFSQLITIDEQLVIPNVFTPDGDGINDLYRIKGSGLKEFSLNIVNRWGETVFHSDDLQISWDGKYKGSDCSEGVYFYVIKASSLNNKYEYQGMITLIK